MATAFPFSSYTLRDSTTLTDNHVISREVMDDGTPIVRVLGSSTYRMIKCEFIPMSIADAEAMTDYLNTNRATEFEMADSGVFGAATYTGYIWSDIEVRYESGVLARVSFDFYGKRA
jgi:hypothetical protein